METDDTSGFEVEYVSVSPHPHGFGTLADGAPFAFRMIRRTMCVEVYRPKLAADVSGTDIPDTDIPDTDDIIAHAQGPVTEIDVTDERSVLAMVRDLLQSAEPVDAGRGDEPTLVRAILTRIGSVIDAI